MTSWSDVRQAQVLDLTFWLLDFHGKLGFYRTPYNGQCLPLAVFVDGDDVFLLEGSVFNNGILFKF